MEQNTENSNRFEVVSYDKIKHLNLFLNNIVYRGFHIHNELELLCVFRGSCTIVARGNAIEAKAGSVVLVGHNVVHAIRADGGADFLVVQISRHILGEYFPALKTTYFEAFDLAAALPAGERARLWGHLYRLARHYIEGDALYQLHCIAAAAELLCAVYRNAPHSSVYNTADYLARKRAEQRIARICETINDNYDGKITLTEIAEAEGLTPTYLSHFFRDHFGVSFQEYLNNVRFDNALRLIADKQLSMNEIAALCGFSEVKYMAKMFRKRFNCTPREFSRRRPAPARGVLRDEETGESVYAPAESLRLLEQYVLPFTKAGDDRVPNG